MKYIYYVSKNRSFTASCLEEEEEVIRTIVLQPERFVIRGRPKNKML